MKQLFFSAAIMLFVSTFASAQTAPDLKIENLALSGWVFSFDVANRGNAESGAVDYQVYVDDVLVETKTTEKLGAAQTRTLLFKLTPRPKGGAAFKSMKIVLDQNNKVSESNEANNVKNYTFKTQPGTSKTKATKH